MLQLLQSYFTTIKSEIYTQGVKRAFMASFVLSFFPLDVLDGIWDLIESVSEGFLTYFCIYY